MFLVKQMALWRLFIKNRVRVCEEYFREYSQVRGNVSSKREPGLRECTFGKRFRLGECASRKRVSVRGNVPSESESWLGECAHKKIVSVREMCECAHKTIVSVSGMYLRK